MRLGRFRTGEAEGWGFISGDAIQPVTGGPDLMEVLGDRARAGRSGRRRR